MWAAKQTKIIATLNNRRQFAGETAFLSRKFQKQQSRSQTWTKIELKIVTFLAAQSLVQKSEQQPEGKESHNFTKKGFYF